MFEKKRGRPEKDGKLDTRLVVRLSDDDYGKLQSKVNESGDTYSDVMRKALRLYYYMTEK